MKQWLILIIKDITGYLGHSEQTKIYSGFSTATSSVKFRPAGGFWNITSDYISQGFLDILLSESTNTSYWLGTRVSVTTSAAGSLASMFGIACVSGSKQSADSFFTGNGREKTTPNQHALRPIVSIPIDQALIGTSGQGTGTSPYNITAK